MISLDLCGRSSLKVKLLPPVTSEGRERARKIPNRIPIYALNEQGKDRLSYWEVPRASLVNILELFKREEIQCSPDAEALINNMDVLLADPYSLPPIEDEIDWIRPPLPHQEKFIRINRSKKALMLAHVQGLGKAASSLMRVQLLGYKKLLIVCNKKTLKKWPAEIRKTLDKPCVVYWAASPAGRKKIDPLLKDAEIIFTTHQQLKFLLNTLKNSKNYFDHIIMDEFTRVCRAKNNDSEQVRRLVQANPDANKLWLSGTPVYNRLKDLHFPVWCLSAEIAGEYQDWKNRYEEVVVHKEGTKKIYNKAGKFVKEIKYKIPIVFKQKNLPELRERIKPLLVRVSRDGITSFKETIDIEEVEMLPRQQEIYDLFCDQVLDEIDEEKKLGKYSNMNALTKVLRLLQVSEGLHTLNDLEHEGESGKFEWLVDEISNYSGKIVTWWKFIPGQNRLYEMFKDRAVLYNGEQSESRLALARWSFNGVDTPEEEAEFERLRRLPHNKDWKFGPGEADLFIATCGDGVVEGIDLHRYCYYQIFLSWPFVGSVIEQAADRLNRLGQEADEVITKFVTSIGSIDGKVLRSALETHKQAKEVLDGEASISYRMVNDLIKEIRRYRKR